MQQQIIVKGYVNKYYDSLNSFLFEHFSLDDALSLNGCELTAEEDRLLCEYGVIKNMLAGVKEVNLSCQNAANALMALDKYKLSGCAVIDKMPAHIELQKRTVFHIKEILAYSDSELEDMAFKLGRAKMPVFITFGRTLNELGQIDKLYDMSPAHYLESLGFLDMGAELLGCNCLDKEELMVLGQYGAKVILTPRSDMALGRTLVNLAPILNQDIAVSLASEIESEVDIQSELRLALGQTASLMNSRNLPGKERVIKATVIGYSEAELPLNVSLKPEVKVDAKSLLRLQSIEKILVETFKEKLWK